MPSERTVSKYSVNICVMEGNQSLDFITAVLRLSCSVTEDPVTGLLLHSRVATFLWLRPAAFLSSSAPVSFLLAAAFFTDFQSLTNLWKMADKVRTVFDHNKPQFHLESLPSFPLPLLCACKDECLVFYWGAGMHRHKNKSFWQINTTSGARFNDSTGML